MATIEELQAEVLELKDLNKSLEDLNTELTAKNKELMQNNENLVEHNNKLFTRLSVQQEQKEEQKTLTDDEQFEKDVIKLLKIED